MVIVHGQSDASFWRLRKGLNRQICASGLRAFAIPNFAFTFFLARIIRRIAASRSGPFPCTGPKPMGALEQGRVI